VSVLADVYNLNNVQYEGPYIPPTVVEEDGVNWWLWLLLLLVLLVVLAFLVARYRPESRAGRTVLRVAAATGADRVYRRSKGLALGAVGKVRGAVPQKRVVRAEVVEEGDTTSG
jgi:H+/Cl- antiporter ClcA